MSPRVVVNLSTWKQSLIDIGTPNKGGKYFYALNNYSF